MNRVADKIAIITGAAAGIGRASAELLAGEGAVIVATDLDEDAASMLVSELPASSARHLALRHDVGDEAGWAHVIETVMKTFGRLDVLVNNAGIGINKPLLETSLDLWRRILRVNLDGVFLGTRMGVDAMRALPSRPRRSVGSIINLSSIAGLAGLPEGAAYCASKGGVRMLTKAVALDCAVNAWQIRVNSVHPGFVETPMNEATLKRLAEAAGTDVAAQRQMLADLHPIGRLATADEIAQGILFLASDESSFMTGSELVIDGGFTAR